MAGRRVVEARQQVEQRCLARPCRATDGHDLPRLGAQIETLEHLGPGRVAEVDVLHPHGERAVGHEPGMGCFGQGLDVLEPGEAAARRRRRTLAQVDDPPERLEGPDELEQKRDEQRELADRERPLDRVAPAEEQDGGNTQAGEEDEPRDESRLDARLTHRLRPHGLGTVAEPVAHVVLTTERLHHLDARRPPRRTPP